MSKRTGKMERKKRLTTEYIFIHINELKARESDLNKLLTDITTCISVVDDASATVERNKKRETDLEEWEKYTNCDELPKTKVPSDIRKFFAKLRMFEEEIWEKTINWLLNIDERSILTQNIYIKDTTKRALIKKIRPNFGIEYERYIDLALKVYKNIETYLDDDFLVRQAKPRVLADIIELKSEIQKEIRNFLDRFSYRVLSSKYSYMNETDELLASEYFYDAKNFQIHIWTLNDVPIRFKYLPDPYMEADLHMIQLNVQIPKRLLKPNLALRGLHLNFDHFSDHAKSNDQENKMRDDNLDGMQDLYECLINEWEMLMDITTEVRNVLLQKRMEYDEKVQSVRREMSIIAKRRTEKPVKVKRIKMPSKEPPLMDNDTYPDVWEDFVTHERELFDAFINQFYHPDGLKMTNNEINLKQYLIVGGIYQLYFADKPKHRHFDCEKLTMTWHFSNGNLRIDDIHLKFNKADGKLRNASDPLQAATAPIPNAQPVRDVLRQSLAYAGLSGGSFDESAEEDTSTDLFILNFKLPEYLCVWGEPIACHFEADLVGFISSISMEESTGLMPLMSKQSVTRVPDKSLSRFFSVPRFESTIRPLSTEHLSTHSMKAMQLKSSKPVHPVDIDDFNLNEPLTQIQIRNIEKFCIPRIISSFQFPSEAKDERFRRRTRRSTLLAKSVPTPIEPTVELSTTGVSADIKQNNPECIFPVFPGPESVFTRMSDVSRSVTENGPEYFLELIDVLDTIKSNYKKKFEQIARALNFEPKLESINKPFKYESGNLEVTQKPAPRKSRKSIHRVRAETRASRRDIISSQPESRTASKQYRPSSRTISRSTKSFTAGNKPDSALQSGEGKALITDASPDSRGRVKSASHAKEVHTVFKKGDEQIKPRDSAQTQFKKKTYKYAHWTTEHIYQSAFDKENRVITIWTDRLGTISFACKRYAHFPFRYWSIEPSEERPATEIVVTIVTQHVKCVIFVTNEGYRGYVTDPTDRFVRNPTMYLVIEEPLKELRELEKRFCEKNLNIFPQYDACFYIENGHFSEKHLPVELHTYNGIVINAISTKFEYSTWNRLAQRRDIVLRFAELKIAKEDRFLVRITPEKGIFVDIKELCSDKLEIVNLEYTPTWRNLDFYADLHQMILSVDPNAQNLLVKDAKLILFLKNLLYKIRLLSYS